MELYCNKHAQSTLPEYELQAYEQICRTIKSQMKLLDLQYEQTIKQFEKENPPEEEKD